MGGREGGREGGEGREGREGREGIVNEQTACNDLQEAKRFPKQAI